jgi:exodeoxyribonuclease V alpha subunit
MPSPSGHRQMPLASDNPASDFHLVPCRDAEDGAGKLPQIIAFPARFGLDPIRDVQALCLRIEVARHPGHSTSILPRALNSTGEPVIERFG